MHLHIHGEGQRLTVSPSINDIPEVANLLAVKVNQEHHPSKRINERPLSAQDNCNQVLCNLSHYLPYWTLEHLLFMLRSTEQSTFSISSSFNRQVDKMTWEDEGEVGVNV